MNSERKYGRVEPIVRRVDPMLVDRHFEPLVEQFFHIFRQTREGGGALAAYLHGEPVVDVWAGWATKTAPWTENTVSLSFSTGKGVVSTVVHRLAERGTIDYDTAVCAYWPEFGAAGKEDITVRELLSHRAGLQSVRGLVRNGIQLLDHELVSSALASATPDPRRRSAPGYHAVTYGSLVAELTARATGLSFTDLVRTEIAEPLGVGEFWYQVPVDQRSRIAQIFPSIRPFGVPWELASMTMSGVPRLRDIADAAMPAGFDKLVRNPLIHDAVMPGWNGVFNARALAKMYAALANNGVVGGTPFLTPVTEQRLSEVQTHARDYVLGIKTHWRLGYHAALVASQRQFPSAFGHYGMGGSGAFADPQSGLSLAFVTNRLGGALTPFADLRLARLGAQALTLARTC